VFVEAIRRVSPNVTRENLRAVLDNMTYETDLTMSPLRWTSANHFANTAMQAFEINSTPESGFTGWSSKGWRVEDRWVGQI
jgi:hypothetical protein